MNWYLKCIKQYADFSGRARRKEYWMFYLFNILAILALSFIGGIFMGITGSDDTSLPIILCIPYYLFILVPSLAVTVRRLHDIGKSGWMILVSLIPLVGGIWLLVLLVTDSQPEANEYGENPKLPPIKSTTKNAIYNN